MASTLRLTFNSSPVVSLNEDININIDTGGGQLTSLLEVFKNTRTRNSEVELSNPYDNNTVASNFATAWNLDYRLSNLNGKDSLVASAIDNIVIISLNIDTWQFVNPTGTSINNGGITFDVLNLPIVTPKTVKINSYSKDVSNSCGKVNVNITATGGNESYTAYVDNTAVNIGATSPFDVNIDRGISKSIRITDTDGLLIGTVQSVSTRKLIPNDVSIKVENYSTGATLTVSVPFITSDISVYQYSLDNVTFQTSNIFTGQSSGNKTIYVKDNFDCVVSKSIVIDGQTTLTETVFEISNINSFRFAKVDDEKKNQLNTLSFNELRLISYPFSQRFLNTDIITTQFKTNAQYIRAYKLVDGIESDLSVLKMTDNINLKAKTTCTYFNLLNGKSGIYFGVVDSLDYLTDDFIEKLNYGSSLPSWASTQGSLVTIEGIGQVPIDGISYSDEYNSFVLEFNIAFTDNPEERKISAEYNLQPYNIYEFDTNISDDLFNVVIEVGSDSSNIDYTYISECIKKTEDSDFLFDITYWDDENIGSFNYQTGIKNKMRVFGYQDDIGEQETEGYNGDKEYYVTDNVIYDVQRFTFNRLSTQIANKLRLIVAHKNILINGLSYSLAESPEVTGEPNFNLKKFVVTLKQSGNKFLTTEQENIVDTPENQSINIALESAKGKGILLWTKNY